jgi:hypothetical protein
MARPSGEGGEQTRFSNLFEQANKGDEDEPGWNGLSLGVAPNQSLSG